MIEYLKTWAALKTDRRGVTALEYALIAAALVTTVVVGFNTLGTDLKNGFESIGGSVTAATTTTP